MRQMNFPQFQIPNYPMMIGIPELPILSQFYSPFFVAPEKSYQSLIANQIKESMGFCPVAVLDKTKNCEENKGKIESKLDQNRSCESHPGRWTLEENHKFINGIKKYKRNWAKIGQMVGTRSTGQIRSHAQKFFTRLQKVFGNRDPIEIISSNEFSQKFPEYEKDLEISQSKLDNKNESTNKNTTNRKMDIRINPFSNDNYNYRGDLPLSLYDLEKLEKLIDYSIKLCSEKHIENSFNMAKHFKIISHIICELIKISPENKSKLKEKEKKIRRIQKKTFGKFKFFQKILISKEIPDEEVLKEKYSKISNWIKI